MSAVGTGGAALRRRLALAAVGAFLLTALLTGNAWGRRATCDGQNATKIGTSRNDVITGTAGDDVIVGREGDDLICGGDGNDKITAGVGLFESDAISGDSGDDLIAVRSTESLVVYAFAPVAVTIDLDNWVTRVFNIDYFGESKMGGLRMWNKLV
jgi:Ca2+-binding RTX toxin-like protein